MDDFTKKLTASVASAKEKIEALRKEDSLVFPIFTDLHAISADDIKVQRLCAALSMITKQVPCDMVADLGDNTGMLGRNMHISTADLKLVIKGMLDRIYASVNCPLLPVNGNHDAIGTDFFESDFWNGLVKNKYGNTNAVYDADGSYYYVDFEKANTRFVVLSVPFDSDLETEHPTPVWAFGKKQLEWLKTKAFNTKGNVILFTHVPFYYWDYTDENQFLEVWTGEKTALSRITDLCGRIEDAEEALKIIKEFDSRPSANLIACFSGHTHRDSLWAPAQKRIVDSNTFVNALPCYQVVTAGTFIPEGEHESFGISVDIAVWTPSKNELNIIRVGDGAERQVPILKKN